MLQTKPTKMWPVVVFLASASFAFVDTTDYTAGCPTDCHCESDGDYMSIDCSHSSSDVDQEQRYRLLDSLLSRDHFRHRLTSLTIADTNLARVPASVCLMQRLTTLSLQRNSITHLPDTCFTKLTNLATLALQNNSITRLHDGLFDGLYNLAQLDLSHNQIASIGLRLFSNASDLTSLHDLNLSYNKLTSLEPWWYYRCIQAFSVTINLSYNLISKFTNELHFNYRCGMKPPLGVVNLNFNRITHIMDMFEAWNIADILKMLCLYRYRPRHHTHLKVFFAGNTYGCDCVDFPIHKLVKMFPRTVFTKGVHCTKEKFHTNTGQPILATAIPLREFVCELSDHCPSSCRCVYRPANATLHVYCSSANISSLPLHLPPLPKSYVKYKLDFSNNKLLRRLEHRPYFVNTSVLDVSNCRLTKINVEDLRDLAHLQVVNFRGNMLRSFQRDSNAVNISARLYLGINPWKCSCDNSWIIKWLQSFSHKISDSGDIICMSPARMYGRNILTATDEDFCVDPALRMLKISLPSVLCPVTVFLIIGFAVYRLRVRLYRRWKFHPFDRDECVGEDMDYDVFLCCSSLDHREHGLRILEVIEAFGYRACFHERDFLPGQLITDNVGQSIERSKRTVCLVTNNFLQRSEFI